MSIFRCFACDAYRDSDEDDGCVMAPDTDGLICGMCVEADAPDLLTALADLEALLVEVAPEYAESTVAANARAAIAKAPPQTEETS